jgi:DHA2 family multidrug resistance protein
MSTIAATSIAAPQPKTGASTREWIAVLAGMIGAFMAILNIQITNASLLDIEGGIGTGVDNGAWISTSYLIGEIVVIPLTAYFSSVFSFRRYILVNSVLFPLFSIGWRLLGVRRCSSNKITPLPTHPKSYKAI